MMLCTGTAIVWAGFNGFGGIWLDYTEEGQMAIGTAGCFFLLFFVLLLVYMLVKNYRERASVKYYIYDILFWILGIAAGIVLFRFGFEMQSDKSAEDSTLYKKQRHAHSGQCNSQCFMLGVFIEQHQSGNKTAYCRKEHYKSYNDQQCALPLFQLVIGAHRFKQLQQQTEYYIEYKIHFEFARLYVEITVYRTIIISRKMKERNRLNFAGNIKHIYISLGYE